MKEQTKIILIIIQKIHDLSQFRFYNQSLSLIRIRTQYAKNKTDETDYGRRDCHCVNRCGVVFPQT